MKSAVFVFKGTVNPTPASKGSTWPSNSLPNNTSPEFLEMVKNTIILKKKYDLHAKLFKKIQDKKFNYEEFIK